jgi:hypothetical protein
MVAVGLKQISAHRWEMPQPLGLFAGDLLKRGKSYYQAFQIVAERDDPGLSFPAYFLLAHAVEVVLRSQLAANGMSKKALREKPFGHDIERIYSECEQKGLAVAHQLMKPLAKQLAHINKEYDLRYPTGYLLPIPSPSHCIAAVDALIAVIEPIVGASAITAELQFAADTQHIRGSKVQWSD